jgi:uncharacterized protein
MFFKKEITAGCCTALLLFSQGILRVQAQQVPHPPFAAGRDMLQHDPAQDTRIGGYLGDRILSCMDHRVMAQDIGRIIAPFSGRPEKDFGGWRDEYWGKWFTSLVLGCSNDATAAQREKMRNAVDALLATQSTMGYIGTYAPAYELQGWDVWGRKYVLLGLIAYYDLTKDRKCLDAACRELDHLMTQIGPGPGKEKITENGLDAIQGLSSSSILEPVALLYERTGKQAYKDFAEYIVHEWSLPGRFNPKGLRLVEDALQGKPPIAIAAPKAYEMMSCYEGLCELYRATGEKKCLDAVTRFANSVLTKEITITGSGSNQELWCDGAREQTEIMQQPMETCVTVTWMKLCYQLLRLTGDPKWADQMEISLYNALLGAMTPGGEWWSYFSPLNGERIPSTIQHEDVGLSCCVANGPRALLLTPWWAVMKKGNGIAVNLFSTLTSRQQLDSTTVTIDQQTAYPADSLTTMTVRVSHPAAFTIAFRIPSWSARSRLCINGKTVFCRPGTYVKLARTWFTGDKITLCLDMRGRLVPAPSGAPQLAVMRGPVVLALDNRLAPPEDSVVALLPQPWRRGRTVMAGQDDQGYVLREPAAAAGTPQQYVTLTPVQTDLPVRMAFEVSFLVRPSHFFLHHEKKLILCDYASAGNLFSADNLFRVWLPQPLFLRYAYPKDTWKLAYPDYNKRPAIPTEGPVTQKN